MTVQTLAWVSCQQNVCCNSWWEKTPPTQASVQVGARISNNMQLVQGHENIKACALVQVDLDSCY